MEGGRTCENHVKVDLKEDFHKITRLLRAAETPSISRLLASFLV